MAEKIFQKICKSFVCSLSLATILGFVLGFASTFHCSKLQSSVKGIFLENLAPMSFHLIACISIFSLSLQIALKGRTQGSVSFLRNFFGYELANCALTIAAVFNGLIIGYAISVWELSLIAAMTITFFATAGILLFILWLSFYGKATNNESLARLMSLLLSFIAAMTVCLEFFC